MGDSRRKSGSRSGKPRSECARTQDAVPAILQQALALHQAGQLSQAEQLYHRVIQLDGQNSEALRLLGTLAFQAKRFSEAVDYLQKAIEIDPADLDARNNLGVLLMETGRTQEAVSCFQQILSFRPDHPQTHSNLGNLLQQHGRYGEAIDHYRSALRGHPSDAQLHNNLGAALKKQGRTVDALACFHNAYQANPQSAETLSNLAGVLKDLGKVEEAATLYREALRQQPRAARIHANLGLLLAYRGDVQQAQACFEEAIHLEPGPRYERELLRILVRSRRFTSIDDPLTEKVLAFLGLPDLPTEMQSTAHFLLGKIYDDCSDYDLAFEHFTAGNRLAGRVFDREAFDRLIDRELQTFTSERCEGGTSVGSGSSRPVFIVGIPRSGTTLVEQILASHPQVTGGGELTDIGHLVAELSTCVGSLAAYPDCVLDLEAAHLAELSARYLAKLEAIDADSDRVTDKMPMNGLHLGLIARLFPKATVIYCQRHPWDVCLSCFFQEFTTGNEFSCDLHDLVHVYGRYAELMGHWRRVLPVRWVDVQYEQLVQTPEPSCRQLVRECGLPWDDSCLHFHQTRRVVQTASFWQVQQPIHSGAIERWRNYEKYLRPLKPLLPE